MKMSIAVIDSNQTHLGEMEEKSETLCYDLAYRSDKIGVLIKWKCKKYSA